MRARMGALGGLRRSLAAKLALIATGTALLAFAISSLSGVRSLQARVFDALSTLGTGALAAARPIVIDIDRETLLRIGPWPWSRDRLAALFEAIAAGEPKAVAVDILLAGPDQRSPAALARSLAQTTGDAQLQTLAERLPDGDKLLAAALAKTSTVLGAVTDQRPGGAMPELRPMLVQGTFDARTIWGAASLDAPEPMLVESAAGLGTLGLAGDDDGSIRHVPLLTLVDGRLVPSLALELLRVASGQPFLLLEGGRRVARAGDHTIRLGRDALLRLVPRRGPAAAPRFSAVRLLDRDASALAALKGTVVVVGGSAPELGGLRPRADGSLAPSVDLQADAYAQLAAGIAPRRPNGLRLAEAVCLLLSCAAGAALARRFGPVSGGLAVAGAACTWASLSVSAAALAHVLVDPVTVPFAGASSFAIASLAVAADARRSAARIRERFEQHLAPAVVRRIAENPDALKLAGELRQITTLFTDLEGFTTMTERAEPRRLIEVLDGYFDGISEIVLAHDGFVDKIVGDAAHALFNAPFELPQHARRGLDCAIALDKFTRAYRLRPEARAISLGRTRIGMESGPAIVGDVGGRRKLDYTAHGSAVNKAARLEQANKVLGTTILVGPGAAELIGKADLMPLGEMAIRGMEAPQAVFTPWPDNYGETRRRAYLAALDAIARQPTSGASGPLAGLLAETPDDPILRSLMQRLAR